MTMLITVLGTTVAAAVALIIAYMQRKQMRQIEAFRQNPSVGLVPPPHPIVLFYRRNKSLINIGIPSALVLALQLVQPGPPTRASTLMIALGVASILMSLLMDLLERLLGTKLSRL